MAAMRIISRHKDYKTNWEVVLMVLNESMHFVRVSWLMNANVNTFCTCLALSYHNLHKMFGTTFLEIEKFKRREHNVKRELSNIYNK